MSFRFLEHTADVQVECRASSFEGLLEEAARALYAIALSVVHDRRDMERTVGVTAPCREEILVRWLQELLFLLDTQRFVATSYTLSMASEGCMNAVLDGYICRVKDRAKEVKSATYHGLKVSESDGGLVARVIFDL
jgi:SHS2 domain-containing protein